MNDIKKVTTLQLFTLVVLRFLIGWHLLYKGISKLITPVGHHMILERIKMDTFRNLKMDYFQPQYAPCC